MKQESFFQKVLDLAIKNNTSVSEAARTLTSHFDTYAFSEWNIQRQLTNLKNLKK